MSEGVAMEQEFADARCPSRSASGFFRHKMQWIPDCFTQEVRRQG